MAEEMSFFFGEYDHVLDPQCRVSLPGEWRRGEGDHRLVLIPGGARDLLMIPFAMFQDLLKSAYRTALGSPAQRIALERIGAVMRQIEPDKQGRIRLERAMLDRIGVGTQLKLIGGITHIKLCSPEVWAERDGRQDAEYLDEIQQMAHAGPDIGDLLRQFMPGGKE